MAELYTLHRLTIDAPGAPLFSALAENVAGLSRRQAREAVAAGLVRVDGEPQREPKAALPLRPVAVEVDLRHGIRKVRLAQIHVGGDAAAVERPFAIIHEDTELVVVDKAAGVLSAPNLKGAEAERGHVPELLRAHWRKQGRRVPFIGTMHRLDRDTSGCLVFALTRPSQRILSAQFAGGAASRIYRCIVAGQPHRDAMTIDSRLGRVHASGKRGAVDDDAPGKDAITHIRVLRRFALGAEIEAKLETGRTHQIRIHLASIRCPVFGDRVYGKRESTRPGAVQAPKAPRLMLHAAKLELDHPANGKRLTVEAPLPQAYREFIAAMAAMPGAPPQPRAVPPFPPPRVRPDADPAQGEGDDAPQHHDERPRPAGGGRRGGPRPRRDDDRARGDHARPRRDDDRAGGDRPRRRPSR
ncbi:MAG TPA: RluA family pseudouridine synthase [Planctomycetota bacterium]|nr:RluA family pseudouridine synthase [Planctomycetota bacterium]